jgi:hypothetical protein
VGHPAFGEARTGIAAAELIELRRLTGGFTLVSAKEVQPGVLVFRLHDQTAAATEVLGTLQVRPDSNPAEMMSFSLRTVSSPHNDATTGTPDHVGEPSEN